MVLTFSLDGYVLVILINVKCGNGSAWQPLSSKLPLCPPVFLSHHFSMLILRCSLIPLNNEARGDKASADRASCRAAVQKSSQAQRLVRTNPPQQPQKQQLEYQRQDPSGANCGSISPSTGSAPTKETVAASFKLKKRRCDVMLKREKEKEKQRKTEADKLHRTEEKRRREEERSKTKEQEAAAANRKAVSSESNDLIQGVFSICNGCYPR